MGCALAHKRGATSISKSVRGSANSLIPKGQLELWRYPHSFHDDFDYESWFDEVQ